MKKFFKISGYVLAGLLVMLILVFIFSQIKWSIRSSKNMALLGVAAPTLEDRGYKYRDLNKNSLLDPYEDVRQPLESRVADLMQQMTLQEKAGVMFITMIGMNDDGTAMEKPIFTDPLTFLLKTNSEMVVRLKMNHFNTVQSFPAEIMARWNNVIQKMAERTRLVLS